MLSQILHGDCTTLLPTLGSFDCVFADPPYIERLLRGYTNPGDRVLDPFCGSGTRWSWRRRSAGNV